MESLELMQDRCYGTELSIKRKRGAPQSNEKGFPAAEVV